MKFEQQDLGFFEYEDEMEEQKSIIEYAKQMEMFRTYTKQMRRYIKGLASEYDLKNHTWPEKTPEIG